MMISYANSKNYVKAYQGGFLLEFDRIRFSVLTSSAQLSVVCTVLIIRHLQAKHHVMAYIKSGLELFDLISISHKKGSCYILGISKIF